MSMNEVLPSVSIVESLGSVHCLYTDARSGLQNLMDTFLPPPTKCSTVNGYNVVHPPVIKQTAESV